MVAGKGIVHAEVSLQDQLSDSSILYTVARELTSSEFQMPLHEEGMPDPEGLQLWIDLPAKDKGIEPSYQDMSSKE